MKHYLFLFSCLFLVFCSCEKDDMDQSTTKGESYTFTSKEVKNVKNFQGFLRKTGSNDPHDAVTGYHKFSFSKGVEVAEDADDWDIAIQGTSIIVNGGKRIQGELKRTGKGACYMIEGLLNDIKSVEFNKLEQKKVPKWYSYNYNTHIITALPGRVIVVRTHDEKYAKMIIKSFYKDNIEKHENGYYYTFDYIYQ